jgi:RNA polymerase sigma factor (sigma-70 family)
MGVTVAEPTGRDFADRLRANDPDLIARLLEGEDEVVDDFYRWLYRALPSRLMRKHGFDYQEAKDLASDVVLQILQHLRQYDPERGSSFVAWIYNIVKNKAVDAYRRQNALLKARYYELCIYDMSIREVIHRRYPHFEDELLRRLGLVEEEEVSPDARLLDDVFACSLSEDEQIIILWKLTFGIDQVAREFGITKDEARQRFRKAMRRLNKAFGKARGGTAS